MVHIIYWNGKNYSLTSSVLFPDKDVILSEDLPQKLNNKAVVLMVGEGGIPTIREGQVTGSSLELVRLVPLNDPLFVIYDDGEVVFSQTDDSDIIVLRKSLK